MIGEAGQNIIQQAVALCVYHGPGCIGDQLKLVFGCPAVKIKVRHTGRLLPLQAADTLPEEFV